MHYVESSTRSIQRTLYVGSFSSAHPQHHQILDCQFLVSRKMKIAPLKLALNSLAIHFEILKADIEMKKVLVFFLKGEGYAYKFERLMQQIQLADCYNMIVISPCMVWVLNH